MYSELNDLRDAALPVGDIITPENRVAMDAFLLHDVHCDIDTETEEEEEEEEPVQSDETDSENQQKDTQIKAMTILTIRQMQEINTLTRENERLSQPANETIEQLRKANEQLRKANEQAIGMIEQWQRNHQIAFATIVEPKKELRGLKGEEGHETDEEEQETDEEEQAPAQARTFQDSGSHNVPSGGDGYGSAPEGDGEGVGDEGEELRQAMQVRDGREYMRAGEAPEGFAMGFGGAAAAPLVPMANPNEVNPMGPYFGGVPVPRPKHASRPLGCCLGLLGLGLWLFGAHAVADGPGA